MKKWILLGALLSGLLFAETRTLRYVIDGDTVKFKEGTCRLSYIDTPESKRNKKATRDVANCQGVDIDEIVESGRYAKRYLKSIMRKGSDYEVKVLGQDHYKRDICIIYDTQGASINERMVRNGFAVPFWKYIRNHQTKKAMISHVRYANENAKGIWRTHKNVMECMN